MSNMRRSIAINGSISTAAVMLAIFLTMTLMALSFPEKARLMPLIVGVAGSVLACIQVVVEIRASSRAATAAEEDDPSSLAAELQMLGWTFLFFLGILGFGFIYASPILVFAFMYFGKDESFKMSVISSIATVAVLVGFFERWLGIPLFEGLILEWLMG